VRRQNILYTTQIVLPFVEKTSDDSPHYGQQFSRKRDVEKMLGFFLTREQS
jgi:hypothetical protein